MGNEQHNPGNELSGIFLVQRFLVAKEWLERAYRHHVCRYGDYHERDYRLVVRVTAIASFLTLSILVTCVARTRYLRYDEQNQVLSSQQLLAQGDYAGAAASAGWALALNGTDPAACRVMADSASLAHLPTELFWVQRLADVAPTTENRLRLVETALRCQTAPFPVASVVLTELAENGANNPAFHMLAGQLAMGLHQPAEAEAQFSMALHLDPANPQYALSLASLQLQSSNQAVKKQALQRLENLSLDNSIGGAALRVLVGDRQAMGDYVAANQYSDQLLASPQVTMADRLQNLEILNRINQDAFTERLRQVMDMAANQATLVAELSTWMQANGLAAENLDWLGNLPKSIRAEQSYKMALAQAYLQTGKWQAMLDFGNRDNWSDQDFLRLAMISRAWAQLGVPTVAQSNWGEAVKKAGDHYEAMTNLLVLAERWQLPDAQQELRQRILQLAPQ